MSNLPISPLLRLPYTAVSRISFAYGEDINSVCALSERRYWEKQLIWFFRPSMQNLTHHSCSFSVFKVRFWVIATNKSTTRNRERRRYFLFVTNVRLKNIPTFRNSATLNTHSCQPPNSTSEGSLSFSGLPVGVSIFQAGGRLVNDWTH